MNRPSAGSIIVSRPTTPWHQPRIHSHSVGFVKEHRHSMVKPCADFSVKSAQAPHQAGPHQDNLEGIQPSGTLFSESEV